MASDECKQTHIPEIRWKNDKFFPKYLTLNTLNSYFCSKVKYQYKCKLKNYLESCRKWLSPAQSIMTCSKSIMEIETPGRRPFPANIYLFKSAIETVGKGVKYVES